jgi:hypothetical protein
VPLSYPLKGGDQIEILTSNSQHPHPEWLEMVTTAKAKSGLEQYFRREERKHIKHGERLFNDAIAMIYFYPLFLYIIFDIKSYRSITFITSKFKTLQIWQHYANYIFAIHTKQN